MALPGGTSEGATVVVSAVEVVVAVVELARVEVVVGGAVELVPFVVVAVEIPISPRAQRLRR